MDAGGALARTPRATTTEGEVMRTIEEANTQSVRELISAVDDGVYDRLDLLLADDFADHVPGRDVVGVAHAKTTCADWKGAFDLKNEVRDVIAAGDKVFVGTCGVGRQLRPILGVPPTGKAVNLSTFEIYRFAEERIAERWMLRDLLSLAPQIGATLPPLDLDALAEYDFYSRWNVGAARPSNEGPADENVRLLFTMFQALGARDNVQLDRAMAPDFRDHHPGIGDVRTSTEYKRNIASFFESMRMTGRTDVIFSTGDRVINRATMMGRHDGTFFGVPATGRDVTWTTIEAYRIDEGQVKERWAVDDLYGLFEQLGVSL
jgi:predicted ester cyclase